MGHNSIMISDDLARALIETHPLEAARILERLEPREVIEELSRFESELRAPVLEWFSPDFAARVLQELPPEEAARLVRELPFEDTNDIFEYLPERDRQALLERLPSAHVEELEELADYEEDTAGSIMSPDYVALREGATVADALTRLRRLALVGREVNYVYVIDEVRALKGVLLMRDLVLNLPRTPLSRVMVPDVLRVYADDPLDEVRDALLERNLLSVPVVDEREHLRGVILATQLVSELQEEGFEDAQKMFGAGSDEHASSSAGFSIRKRLPWMQVNLLTAFLAAAVVGAFDGIIAQITILAAFLPVVAGQGGNAGAQAQAVMLRSLALEDVDIGRSRKVLLKEGIVGAVNGAATGVVAGLAASLFSGNVALGVVVAGSMTINLLVAGVAGAGIPIIMERLGQDPAQSSNIILTTVTDVLGFASFLGFAVLARPWLLS